jgi:hypothetical protein
MQLVANRINFLPDIKDGLKNKFLKLKLNLDKEGQNVND